MTKQCFILTQPINKERKEMKVKTETIYCDIDDCKSDADVTEERLQVIFTTDQTEGRGTEPYLSNEGVDLCEKCLKKVLKGNYIFAHGAQGHNTFYFKNK